MINVCRLLFSSLFLAVTVSFLTGCAETVLSRIEKNPQAWAQVQPEERQLILRGRIDEGFERYPVYFAWGKPGAVFQGSTKGKRTEIWQYSETRTAVANRFGYRNYGYFGHGWGYYDVGPEIITYKVPGKRVIFENDKVTEWYAPLR